MEYFRAVRGSVKSVFCCFRFSLFLLFFASFLAFFGQKERKKLEAKKVKMKKVEDAFNRPTWRFFHFEKTDIFVVPKMYFEGGKELEMTLSDA